MSATNEINQQALNEHDTSSSIPAKKVKNYVWNANTLAWERQTSGSAADGHVVLAGTEVNQKDDANYGDGVTSGVASVHSRKWNGTSYDRDWGQAQIKAYAYQATSDDGTYKYYFFEDASLNYYIMRKHKTNKVATYTKGTGGYSAVYVSSSAGPSGTPTWGTYGATF